MELDIEGVDVALVNAIRRILISEIPNVALDPDRINIHTNTCSLHNEILSHRLSLIPLCFESSEIESFDHDAYRFVIKMKNTSNGLVPVTTKNIAIYNVKNEKALPESVREKIFPRNAITGEHILITKLKP
jgi:DNA-directed RNA polymerase alpha subunit